MRPGCDVLVAERKLNNFPVHREPMGGLAVGWKKDAGHAATDSRGQGKGRRVKVGAEREWPRFSAGLLRATPWPLALFRVVTATASDT